MTDNKRKRGKHDRRKVASKQSYEVRHVAKKFGISAAMVRLAIKEVGVGRTKLYARLREAYSS